MTKGRRSTGVLRKSSVWIWSGHSAENPIRLWTFKTAFEQGGTEDGETVKRCAYKD